VIRCMQPDLVAQIKAGEVVERPASVVKELLENSLDAGARRIRVEVQAGGTQLIRVVDDGEGIAPEQLELAFAEHTSSKLHTVEGLESIGTLGFRGEALHAIASVSRVEAVSTSRESAAAARLVIDHGLRDELAPAPAAGGTRISVHDLFARVPARRKHLRSNRSEAMAIHQVVAQYAIGHPAVAISLESDGRPSFASPGTGQLADAFAAVFGSDVAGRMLPVHAEGDVGVDGIITPPDISRSNRSGMMVFVNGRPVKSPALTFAIEDAYSGQLMAGRHPLAAVAVTLPTADVDANVHPAKLEVRFTNDRKIFAVVRSAVATPIQSKASVPVAAVSQHPWQADPVDSRSQEPRRSYPDQVRFPVDRPSAATPSMADALPALRVFGQSAQTFIVAEGPAGLYMIDQHAAHERVIFDELTGTEARPPEQGLLEPVQLELSDRQMDALEAHGQEIAGLSFMVEPLGGNWCVVRSVPMVRNRTVEAEAVLEVLDALEVGASAEEVLRQAIEIVACKAAVKAGQVLTMTEMRELVSQLERTAHPRTCPHGRPTTIHISLEKLEREFGRR